MLLWGLILLALAAMYLAGLIIREMLHQRAYAKMVETLPPTVLRHECDVNSLKLADAAGEHEPQPGVTFHRRAIFCGRTNVLSERIAPADRLCPDKIVIGETRQPLVQLHNGNLEDRPALAGKRTEQAV